MSYIGTRHARCRHFKLAGFSERALHSQDEAADTAREDLEELDLEANGGAARDAVARAGVAVGDVGRDGEFEGVTLVHEEERLLPALDDLLHRELGGLAARARRVEDRAVDERADVVHLDGRGLRATEEEGEEEKNRRV